MDILKKIIPYTYILSLLLSFLLFDLLPIVISSSNTNNSSMVNVWIPDYQFALIIRHTEKTPALFIRELIQEELEQNGWSNK